MDFVDSSNNGSSNDENGRRFLLSVVTAFFCVALLALAYIFYPAYLVALRRRPSAHLVTVSSSSSSSSSTWSKGDETNSSSREAVLLSIIIPAYNEEERLVQMLEAAHSYLVADSCPALKVLLQAYNDDKNKNKASPFQSKDSSPIQKLVVEWILVNDGSTDQTCHVFESYVKSKYQSPTTAAATTSTTSRETTTTTTRTTTNMIWRLCTLSKNSGKGAAVRAGMLLAQGYYRLMVDADGATDFGPGLEALAQYVHNHEFVFGSRANVTETSEDEQAPIDAPSETTLQQRDWFRKLLQGAFHALVVLVVGYRHVQDTQCGFKLFVGPPTARTLFEGLHLHQWAFDIELFVRAYDRRRNIRIREVAVPWQEIEGSKLHTSTINVIRVALGMLRDMICVRLCYTLGIWSVVVAVEEDEEEKKSGEEHQRQKQPKKEQ
ncbi:hypothetical protein ACA910_004179 [Epithemia clementina (nom. ined.)]